MLVGALEAGGTKMVMAVGDETGTILEQKTIPTSTPEETMPQIVEFFKEKIKERGIVALGTPFCRDQAIYPFQEQTYLCAFSQLPCHNLL